MTDTTPTEAMSPVGDVPATDEDCATRLAALECVCELENPLNSGKAIEEMASIIAAHVASRLAPVQAELETAIQIIDGLIHAWDNDVEQPTYHGTINNARAFLTRHQRDNAQGEGMSEQSQIDRTRWDEELQCGLIELKCNFRHGTVSLTVPSGHCTSMSGAIALAKRVYPEVAIVAVFPEDSSFPDMRYCLEAGTWTAKT